MFNESYYILDFGISIQPCYKFMLEDYNYAFKEPRLTDVQAVSIEVVAKEMVANEQEVTALFESFDCGGDPLCWTIDQGTTYQ